MGSLWVYPSVPCEGFPQDFPPGSVWGIPLGVSLAENPLDASQRFVGGGPPGGGPPDNGSPGW